MDSHDHSGEPTLSTPSTLSKTIDPDGIEGNPVNHGGNEGGRAERVDRVALRKGSLLAGLFGIGSTLEPEAVATTNDAESDSPPLEPPPDSVEFRCQFCESVRLSECHDPPGIRCDDCGCLVWIDDGESLCKVGWHDHDLGAMAPEDLPPCGDCGRSCDTQTLDDAWHCSRCLPDEATARRDRTEVLLSQVADVRRYTDLRNG